MAKVRVNLGPFDGDGSVRLYEVRNTSGNSLYVLARDESTAMSIAWAANHVYSTLQKIAEPFSRMAEEVRNPSSWFSTAQWKSIQSAISRRVQGTLHFEGDNVAVGDEVLK